MRFKKIGVAMGCILMATASSAQTPQDAEALAQRFRPYYKFSVDESSQERHRPCSWQWLYARSLLRRADGEIILGPEVLGTNPAAVLGFADVRALGSNPGIAGFNLNPLTTAYEGEPWDSVIRTGAGLYAHVTQVNARLVNIEYWTLYAYNRTTVGSDHVGDITAFHVVYDRALDRLVRVTYGMHGGGIEAFDLTRASVQPGVLDGVGPAGNPVRIGADKYTVFDDGQHQNGPVLVHDDSDKIVYLVRDPQTGRAEHPAVFIEWGSHEPWPNETGSWIGAPKHRGDGVSFLPDRVRLLGPGDDPFRYFGGRFVDPVGLLRHRFWLFEGIFIPESLRNDRDPYTSLGPLRWPPVVHAGCARTAPFSEESPGVGSCSGPMRGIACTGDFCDNLSLECCLEPPVRTNPGTGYWSEFFSEENGGQHICRDGRYVQAIACNGRFCDNLALRCESQSALAGACRWTPFFSDGNPIGECAVSEVVAGLKCRGRFCDDLSLYCCRP